MKIYEEIKECMQILENIDLIDFSKRAYSQKQVNRAYQALENIRDELEKEI